MLQVNSMVGWSVQLILCQIIICLSLAAYLSVLMFVEISYCQNFNPLLCSLFAVTKIKCSLT